MIKKEVNSKSPGSWRQGEVICKSLEVKGNRLTLDYYNLDKTEEEFIGEMNDFRPDKKPGDFWWGKGGSIKRDGDVVYDDDLLHYIDEYNNERIFEKPYSKFSVTGELLSIRRYVFICNF